MVSEVEYTDDGLVIMQKGFVTPDSVIEARERAGEARTFEQYARAMRELEVAWIEAGF